MLGTQKVTHDEDTTQISLLSPVMEHRTFKERIVSLYVLECTYTDIITIQITILLMYIMILKEVINIKSLNGAEVLLLWAISVYLESSYSYLLTAFIGVRRKSIFPFLW